MESAKHRKLLITYGAITFAIMLVIFLMSAQDGNESGSFSNGFLKSLIGGILSKILPPLTDKGFAYDIRKYAHMFEYFCLGVSSFLLFSEVFLKHKGRLFKTTLVTLCLCFLYACSDEFHQRFVPGRAGRLIDVGVDSVGYVCAVLIMLLFFLVMQIAGNRKTESM